jgi:hypothetical protein
VRSVREVNLTAIYEPIVGSTGMVRSRTKVTEFSFSVVWFSRREICFPAIRFVSLRHTVHASRSDIQRSLSETPRNREAKNGDSESCYFCFFDTESRLTDKVRPDLWARLNFGLQ